MYLKWCEIYDDENTSANTSATMIFAIPPSA